MPRKIKPPPLKSHSISRLLKIASLGIESGEGVWSQEVCGGCFFPWAFLFSLAVLGLGSCAGFSRVAVRGPLMALAFLREECGLSGTWASAVVAPRSRAQAQHL